MKYALCLCALLFIWPFSSGHTVRLIASSAVPAASGTVKVSTGSNGNLKLEIKVQHLAQPASLTPPEAVYLVWVQPVGQPAQKMGVIRLDDDLNGQLKLTTAMKNGQVLITPEQSDNALTPSQPAVLRAHIQLKAG